MENRPFYSIVIPVRNEKKSLPGLQAELSLVMPELNKAYEIIYVDDASNDSSASIIEDLKKTNPYIRLICFAKNYGQSAALLAGFRAAKGEWIITLDADGQNPPEEIPLLIEESLKGWDCVTGIRSMRKDSWTRKQASSLARLFRRCLLGDTTQDTGCSLRMFKRSLAGSLPYFKNFHRFFIFIMRCQGYEVKEIPVNHRPRIAGETKYNNFTRLKEGLIDIWGVWWLKQRLLSYTIKNEN